MNVYLVWTWDPIIPVDEGAYTILHIVDSEEKAKKLIKNYESKLLTKYDKEHTEYRYEVRDVE